MFIGLKDEVTGRRSAKRRGNLQAQLVGGPVEREISYRFSLILVGGNTYFTSWMRCLEDDVLVIKLDQEHWSSDK